MLHVVATPIGNLSDLSVRAREVLKHADLILAEDTRVSSVLLRHYEIKTPMRSVHEHTPDAVLERLITQMRSGKTYALVSDAGTPGVSDPGGKLVALAHAAGVEVSPIPGPCAVTAALSVAGLSAQSFVFLGYFPKKKGRQTLARVLAAQKQTVVFFETAPRLTATLTLLGNYLPSERVLVVCRELTKLHEQVVRTTVGGVAGENIPLKGEFVIVLAGI